MAGVSGTGLILTPMDKVLAEKKEIDMDVYTLAEDLAR